MIYFVLLEMRKTSLTHFFFAMFCQAADLDGEIDLSTCFDVTEYPVQRNYGFQIHVRETCGEQDGSCSEFRRWLQLEKIVIASVAFIQFQMEFHLSFKG